MPAIGPDRIVKARKPHKCDLCGLHIRRRATYVLREGADGREHWRMRMHPVCEHAASRWDLDDWELGLDAIDFRHYELNLPLLKERR